MKKVVIFLLFILVGEANMFSQGLIINDSTDKTYKNTPSKYSKFSNGKDGLPAVVDMAKYLPTIINQAQFGTCVGVSSAYYMRTILEAQRLRITNRKKIDNLRFSPSYLYNSVKKSTDSKCIDGTEISLALDFMRDSGSVYYNQIPYHTCAQNLQFKPTANSKIMDYIKVFGLTDQVDDATMLAKKALSERTPIVIGILATKSLQEMYFKNSLWARFKHYFHFSLSEEEDFRLWKPFSDKTVTGGHAVCVIGYDNIKYGGAFKVVNSWGEWWGDKGVFWIKYADFPKVARYCYQAYLKPSYGPNEISMEAEIQLHFGTFSTLNDVPFVKTKYNSLLDTTNQLIAYNLAQPQQDSTKYYFEANLKTQTYLYLIGKNNAVKAIQKLYPNTDSTSELMGIDTKFLLPSPVWDKTSKSWTEMHYSLVPPLGKEYWLFLFSKKKLNIDEIIQNISLQKGNFQSQIMAALGDELIPAQSIKYDNKKIGFTVLGVTKGNIVPLLISFDHIPMDQGFLPL